MAEMMKGNEAIAEAAIRAGARFYAGYPITPSSEIMEYLSWRMNEVGGAFVQAESELAGINMVIGASSCGVRALTASSGPGISLKQEGISTLCDEGLPAVVITQVRYGNGLGTLFTSQCDYHRETRGGGQGDYRCIVLCPSSIQEFVDLMLPAYELAEKYRIVTIMMGEGTLGQMMEPVELPDFVEPKRTPWALNGHYTYVFVAYGVPGRATLGAVRELRAAGEKVGLIRPITAWPYPEKAFANINPNVKGIITVEENATGQMIDDAALAIKKTHKDRNIPAYALTYVYNTPPINRIKEDYFKVKSGEIKEVY